MTAQEIIDHFKVERRSFQMMSEQNADADRTYLWDDMRTHASAFLDQVDPKRQIIVDEQLHEAMKV